MTLTWKLSKDSRKARKSFPAVTRLSAASWKTARKSAKANRRGTRKRRRSEDGRSNGPRGSFGVSDGMISAHETPNTKIQTPKQSKTTNSQRGPAGDSPFTVSAASFSRPAERKRHCAGQERFGIWSLEFFW